MLSKRSVLSIVDVPTIESTRWLAVDVAGEAIGKWVYTGNQLHLEAFLRANEVVQLCFDEIEYRQRLRLGTDRGQVEKW